MDMYVRNKKKKADFLPFELEVYFLYFGLFFQLSCMVGKPHTVKLQPQPILPKLLNEHPSISVIFFSPVTIISEELLEYSSSILPWSFSSPCMVLMLQVSPRPCQFRASDLEVKGPVTISNHQLHTPFIFPRDIFIRLYVLCN